MLPSPAALLALLLAVMAAAAQPAALLSCPADCGRVRGAAAQVEKQQRTVIPRIAGTVHPCVVMARAQPARRTAAWPGILVAAALLVAPPAQACDNNGICNAAGEDCSECAQDCVCPPGWMCDLKPPFSCGCGSADSCFPPDCPPGCCVDQYCAFNENPCNCPEDCGSCCIDASCDAAAGEDCGNCGDCACGLAQFCDTEQAPPACALLCGDGFCDAVIGEDPCTCEIDCTIAQCGDGCCTGGEDPCSCLADCPSACPDGCCDSSESGLTCPADCPPTCGNGLCEPGETACCLADPCPASCGDGCCTAPETACPGPGQCLSECSGSCGDGCCSGAESPCNCGADCPGDCCGDASCTGTENSCTCPRDCGTDTCGNGCCGAAEDACGCAGDCGADTCGNSCCGAAEEPCGCPADCPGTCCGDGVCDEGEDCAVCFADCGPCEPEPAPEPGPEPPPDARAEPLDGAADMAADGRGTPAPDGCSCQLGRKAGPPTLLLLWLGLLLRARRGVRSRRLAGVTALLAAWTLSSPALAQTSIEARIVAGDAPSLASDLEADGFDVLRGSIDATSLRLIVSPEEYDLLSARGYEIEPLSQGRPLSELQQEQAAEAPVPTGYPTLGEILDQMTAVAAAYPAICRFVDLTANYGAPPTFEGRHLYAVKISDNVVEDEDEPAFLVVGTHHAREVVTPVIALETIDRFTTQYGTDDTATGLVDGYEIWVAPVWNPDGYQYVFDVDNLWRKNRTVFPDGVGADLNRNYPFGWPAACSGSSSVTSSTYKGPWPASEAETETMMSLSEDRRFAKVLDLHSWGREVVWGYRCLAHPFASFLRDEAVQLSLAAGYGGTQRPPGAEGEQFEWQLAMMGSHAFLLETHTEFQPGYASALAEADLVWPAVLSLLERPISLSGHVRDVCSGAPLSASIVYQGVDFSNGEQNWSGGTFGRYHATLPAGNYTILFSAPGYVGQAQAVVVTAGSAELLDVALVPEGWADADGDRWLGCAGDCDDGDAEVYTGAPERCNGVDDNCDGEVPSDEADADDDGYPGCAGDCDDGDADVSPGALERCNGVDDDCDGTGDETCEGASECDGGDGCISDGGVEEPAAAADGCACLFGVAAGRPTAMLLALACLLVRGFLKVPRRRVCRRRALPRAGD